ncbi:synaptonemal complex protein 2 isoform X1 [Pyxicephalus adspersus]|uniref:Synaptonemal complex protein 2 Spt16M-like domain-containing protein n=1 Tax=Pyxicephalus adspersus TaxID=30357 RepID=A0AAV3AGQ2_PYXAD|nr:TPA: hypothetical protein GDO54_013167 [Pyxicephalus adspersus]
MLDTLPREIRRKLIFSNEMMAIMSAMGKRILDSGDYDLQVAITEALCRMTSEVQRAELANHWFPMEFVSNAFKKIRDVEFETDCRKFLNLVNGMLGDKRRVFTFPCLSAHLENQKLQTPSDEKLEEFWIDFNIGTQSLSFYVSTADEDHQWETVCITDNEVDVYNIEAVGNKMLLTVALNTAATVGQIKGSRLRIFFDSALDITNVVRKVFGAHKCKVLIPESQESMSSGKHNALVYTSDIKTKNQLHLTTPSSSQPNCDEDSVQSSNKMVTPSRPKVSEASISIVVPGAQKAVSPIVPVKTSSLGKAKMKPPLEIINSAQRKMFVVPSHKDNTYCLKKMPANKQKLRKTDVESMKTVENAPHVSKRSPEEQIDFIPDTQFPIGKNTPRLPGFLNTSFGLSKKPTRTVRQNEKASVTNDFLSNKGETSAQNKKPTGTSHLKSQPQEVCKNTKADGQSFKRQNSKNIKMPDASLNGQTKESDVHSQGDDQPKKSDKGSKKESTKVANYQSPGNIVKKKELQKPKDERTKCLHDATQSLLAKIGSKYSCSVVKKKQAEAVWQNISDYSTQNKKGRTQNKVKLKEKRKLTKARKGETCSDIYSFQSAEGDNPTIELGASTTFLPKPTSNATLGITEKPVDKGQKCFTVAKQKSKSPRRHLFSDTDTDRGVDDTKTDFSWLKETASKKKPKILGYSRQKLTNKPETKICRTEEVPKQYRKRKAPCKETFTVSSEKEDDQQVARHKRPQRGAVKRKCYKEASNTESESEELTLPIRKETARDQYGLQAIRKQLCKETPQKPTNLTRRKQDILLNLQDSAITSKADKTPHKNLDISPISSSPESIDQVRAEHLDLETGLPIKNSSFTQLPSSPSPSSSPLASLTLEKSLSIPTVGKNVSKHGPKEYVRTGSKLEVCETVQKNLSPAPSRNSMASVTLDHSTISGMNFLNVPDPDYNEQLVSVSPISGITCLQSHTLTLKKSHCASHRSGSVVKKTANVTHATFHESGPTKRKAVLDLRHKTNDSSHLTDNSIEGSDQGTKRRKIKLLPRRLFPATEVKEPRVSRSLSTFSEKEESTEGLDTWDRSDTDVGVMCQNIGKEYTRKIQSHSRKMDYFTEQSVKSVQKHLTSVETQVRECRMKHLEKFQQTILEEIENFEQDSKALKQMEKEFNNFWSQQTQVMSVYHSNQQKRIGCLKASFENNVSRCTDFEGKIFTSEMHVMKEDMKNVQELLLRKMHEEDLLSVRKGLQSLFTAGAGSL